MKLVVVGAFECPARVPFPSHVPPILAEYGSQGFRRVFYDAELRPVEIAGEVEWKKQSTQILPKISIIRCSPTYYSVGDQVIYLGASKLIVTSSKLKILYVLLPHIFSPRWPRALVTLLNVWL